MSYFAFPTDNDGNIIISGEGIEEWMNFMAEQAEKQTLLLEKAMDLEGITIEELKNVT